MDTRKIAAFSFIILLNPLANQIAFADASYQTTSQMTGGFLVNQVKMGGAFMGRMTKKLFAPTNTLTMVHGNQKAVVTKETTVITDLDKGTITTINTAKKTYMVITFDQMRKGFADMAKQTSATPAQPADQPKADPSQLPKMTVVQSVKNTGVTKVINGLTAQEQVLTMSMKFDVPAATVAAEGATAGSTATPTVAPTTAATAASGPASGATTSAPPVTALAYTVTTDNWIAPDPPQIKEIQAFDLHMGEKLMAGIDPAAFMAQMTKMKNRPDPAVLSVMGGQPGGAAAMEQMSKEMAKIKGTRVLSVMSVGGMGGGLPTSAPAAANAPAESNGAIAGQVATDTAKQTAEGEAGRLGVFGSALANSAFGAFHKKKTAPAPAPAPVTPAPAAGAGTGTPMMEITEQTTNFSSDPIPPSVFEVPAGFKRIDLPTSQTGK